MRHLRINHMNKKMYYVENSKIIISDCKNKKNKRLIFIICNLIMAYIIFTFTIFIFENLQLNNDKYTIISVGAIFATLGSTMVSISSLICSRFYNEFVLGLKTLKNEFLTDKIDDRWNFINDSDTIIKNEKGRLYYFWDPVKIIFTIGTITLKIIIPTHKNDFNDLELLKNLIKMTILKKTFVQVAYNNSDYISESGIYAWECLYSTLRYALLYKINYYFVIAGIYFFISGIIATLLYATNLQSNFQNIILTITT